MFNRSTLFAACVAGLLVPASAGAVAGFTPQVTLGLSADKTTWNATGNELLYPTGTSFMVGGRLGYDISFIPILSIDVGVTVEFHKMKVSDSFAALGVSRSAVWVGAGPSARINLGIIEPFAGIDFGGAWQLISGGGITISPAGFVVSPYGGAYFRLLKFFSVGPIIRFTTGTQKYMGTEVGSLKLISVALSVKFNI